MNKLFEAGLAFKANPWPPDPQKPTLVFIHASGCSSLLLEEAFEQGIISQAELKIAQDQAREQRVNAELAAEKKLKDEKKKAAQLEKANSLFQIAIGTAKNIVEQPGHSAH